MAANIDKASLACPLLTSCSVGRFLTDQELVLVCGPGVGDPCPIAIISLKLLKKDYYSFSRMRTQRPGGVK